ncbi:MAG: hypothetical protein EB168_08330, partial [Euryarchaeota archaeon]|nr:hypothetical protein [Euryarchaeota archaeon]
MLEFINFLPTLGEFTTTLLGWLLLALVPALTVAWGLTLGNETLILDDFIVWEEQKQRIAGLEGERIQFLEETINRLLLEKALLKEENLFLLEEARALARENDALRKEKTFLKEKVRVEAVHPIMVRVRGRTIALTEEAIEDLGLQECRELLGS